MLKKIKIVFNININSINSINQNAVIYNNSCLFSQNSLLVSLSMYLYPHLSK